MRRALFFFLPVVCSPQALDPFQVHTVSASHLYIEGPVWSAPDNFLLYSDTPSNKIHRIDSKGPSVFRTDIAGATGNAFDDKGRLYTCEARGRRVTRTDKKGRTEVLAVQFEGKKLNGPNDIVVTRQGHVYFTDPAFGSALDTRELPFHGVFHISSKGELAAVLQWQTRPNGLAVSPDGNRLYISNSDERNVRMYDIAKDGVLGNERMFIAKTEGVPGGLEIDTKGNLYVAGSDVQVYSPDGKPIGKIELAEKPSNLAFGDSDLRSLYVTARSTLYRVRFEPKEVSPD